MHQIKSGAKWMRPFIRWQRKRDFCSLSQGECSLYHFEYMPSSAEWGTGGAMGAHLLFPTEDKAF